MRRYVFASDHTSREKRERESFARWRGRNLLQFTRDRRKAQRGRGGEIVNANRAPPTTESYTCRSAHSVRVYVWRRPVSALFFDSDRRGVACIFRTDPLAVHKYVFELPPPTRIEAEEKKVGRRHYLLCMVGTATIAGPLHASRKLGTRRPGRQIVAARQSALGAIGDWYEERSGIKETRSGTHDNK